MTAARLGVDRPASAPLRGLVDRVRALSLLLRTGSVVAASALCLVGARLAGGDGAGDGGRAAVATVLVAAAVAFAQVVNDLTDLEVDRVGKPFRPLVAGTVGVPAARAVAAAAAAVSLLAGAALGPAFVAVAALLLGLSWGYSRWWKGTVLLGNAVVALLTSTPVLVGAAAAGGVGRLALSAQVLVLVFMAGFELVKTGLDHDGDRAAGVRTVATAAGLRTAALLAAACCVGFAVVAAAPAVLAADGRAYAAVMVPGAVLPTLVAAAILVRRGRTAADLRRPLTLLRLAWYSGIAALVLL